MLKILQNHYSATGDRRVIDCLSRYFDYQLRELPKTPLDHWTFWGQRRGADNLMVVLWLYNVTGQPRLLELAELIESQTYPHADERVAARIALPQENLESIERLRREAYAATSTGVTSPRRPAAPHRGVGGAPPRTVNVISRIESRISTAP